MKMEFASSLEERKDEGTQGVKAGGLGHVLHPPSCSPEELAGSGAGLLALSSSEIAGSLPCGACPPPRTRGLPPSMAGLLRLWPMATASAHSFGVFPSCLPLQSPEEPRAELAAISLLCLGETQ